MSYPQWRLMRAIELLATGRSIGYIAFDPRFVSDSAFMTLSKDMTGTTPRGWLK